MPQKVRELKQQLTKIGFQKIPGKGKDSSDAKSYQEKAVNEAIEEVLRKKTKE
jgi:hypothetical protein